MTSVTRCPDCGRERPADASSVRLCPFCLLQLGLDARPQTPSPWLDPEQFSCQVLNVLRIEGGKTSYLAVQEAPARRFVVLTQLKMALEKPDDRARVEATLQAMVEFAHALVERVMGGLVSDSGVAYLVTEHVSGTPLARHCERVNADSRQRAALCLSVVEAIRAAHEHGIVHGALTPARLIVTPRWDDPAPVVTGLGTALQAGAAPTASGDVAALVEVGRLLGLAVPPRPCDTAAELASWLRPQTG